MNSNLKGAEFMIFLAIFTEESSCDAFCKVFYSRFPTLLRLGASVY
jgi:hypothetical protein